jgi:hypothetical protein
MKEEEKNIYNYRFSGDVMGLLKGFASSNRLTTWDKFKENWEVWKLLNEEMIILEKGRLINLGYKKCVEEKMFISVRYYLTSKEVNNRVDGTVSLITRRKYIPLNRELLDVINKHVENTRGESPKTAYENFMKENVGILKCEGNRLEENYGLNESEIKLKIAKTYKNKLYSDKKNKKLI